MPKHLAGHDAHPPGERCHGAVPVPAQPLPRRPHQAAKVRPILNRRLATAAAYFLAVLTSLVIGNPVTLARSETVGRVATVVTTEVEQVAVQGRGEARIALWRIWKWGEKKVEAVRDFVGGSDKEAQSETDSSSGEQGETS